MADTKLQSFYNVGPRDFILDFLETLGWNQNDLADVTDFSLKNINQLINNKQGRELPKLQSLWKKLL